MAVIKAGPPSVSERGVTPPILRLGEVARFLSCFLQSVAITAGDAGWVTWSDTVRAGLDGCLWHKELQGSADLPSRGHLPPTFPPPSLPKHCANTRHVAQQRLHYHQLIASTKSSTHPRRGQCTIICLARTRSASSAVAPFRSVDDQSRSSLEPCPKDIAFPFLPPCFILFLSPQI